MNRSPLSRWLCACASEFVEGLADGFIIVAGGAQAAAAATSAVRAVSPQEIACSNTLAQHDPAAPLRGFNSRFSNRFRPGGPDVPVHGFSERFSDRFQPQP